MVFDHGNGRALVYGKVGSGEPISGKRKRIDEAKPAVHLTLGKCQEMTQGAHGAFRRVGQAAESGRGRNQTGV